MDRIDQDQVFLVRGWQWPIYTVQLSVISVLVEKYNSTLILNVGNEPNNIYYWWNKQNKKERAENWTLRDTSEWGITRGRWQVNLKIIILHEFVRAIIIIIIYFTKRQSFYTQLGFDVPPEMKPLHISLNTAYSGCKPSAFISSFTHLYQASLPLPAHLTPATTTFLQADTQSSSLLHSICPNHLNLPHLTTSSTLCTPKRLQIHFLSFSDSVPSLPDDDLNNFRSISNLNFISKILEKVV